MSRDAFIRAVGLLISRWMWLLAAAVLSAAAAWLIIVSKPPLYQASLDVLPKRARTEVNYDTKIKTLSTDSTSGATTAGLGAVTPERRQALAQLVRNPDIERTVRQELGTTLPVELREPGKLLRRVSGRIPSRSEAIVITVEAPTPKLAEEIAVAWARAYEKQVNQLFTSSILGASQLDREVADSRRKYEQAEQALNQFIATSPANEYTRQMEQLQNTQKALSGATQTAYTERIQDSIRMLTDLYKANQRLAELLAQADALQQQLQGAQDNSAAASSALALTILKTQAFSASSSLPANLQIQLPAAAGVATLAQQRADVAATVRALKAWQAQIQQAIDNTSADELILRGAQQGPQNAADATSAASGTTDTDLNRLIRGVEQEIRTLQVKIAEQAASQKKLQLDRDVAWDSYTTLVKKAEEARVGSVVGAGNEVSVASETAVAELVERMRLIYVLPLAATMGLLAGAVIVLLSDGVGVILREVDVLQRRPSWEPAAIGATDGVITSTTSGVAAGGR